VKARCNLSNRQSKPLLVFVVKKLAFRCISGMLADCRMMYISDADVGLVVIQIMLQKNVHSAKEVVSFDRLCNNICRLTTIKCSGIIEKKSLGKAAAREVAKEMLPKVGVFLCNEFKRFSCLVRCS
jgi:hypothetical protein